MPVGMKATNIFFKISAFKNDFPYKTITDKIAPNWIIISKLFVKLDWPICRNLLASIRWPVDDIGKNSVIPSTIPNIKLCRIVMFDIVSEKF